MSSRQLPAHQELSFYRRRAKALLRSVRAGDQAALVRVHDLHPRYREGRATAQLDSRARPFTLADAQLVVARELGAASWPELKRRLTRAEDLGAVERSPLPEVASQAGAASGHDRIHDWFERQSRDVGFIVGRLDRRGLTISARRSERSRHAPDGGTPFQVSPAPLTGLLLADLVRKRRMTWTDPLSRHLPRSVRVPRRRDNEISLLELITGRSGLPAFPNAPSIDAQRPFSDFTATMISAWLDGLELRSDVRTPQPSLVALWLLQLGVAHRVGAPFDRVLDDVVFKPLGMAGTRSGWDESLAGAADLRSTASDQLALLRAFVDPAHSAIGETIGTLLYVRNTSALEHPIGWASTSIDHAFVEPRHAVIWTDCSWRGTSAFVGFSRRDAAGVVVAAFAEQSTQWMHGLQAVDALGLYLLDDRWPAPDVG